MLKDLKDSYQNLSHDEKQIFDARMVGYAVSDMNNSEVQVATTGIIFKVSVICGCQLPTHDAHINALEQEFVLFLTQNGYDILTVEEILMAFRMNVNFQLKEKIETYGAIFNIDYASKVLKQYIDKRFKLDHKLGTISRNAETEKILAQEEKNRRIKVVEQFNKYLIDDNAELDLANCYMQLVHDGAFANKRFDDMFMREARDICISRGYEHNFGTLLAKYNINPEASFVAGYLAVRHLFREMKIRDRREIYNSDWKIIHPGYYLRQEESEPEFKFNV